MEHSNKYNLLMSQLRHIKDIKETEKTKISVVYHEIRETTCILRICKNRDLSDLCRALMTVRNPNMAVVYDYAYENGDTYICEEQIDGTTVEELMKNNGLFSEKETAKIVIEVCKALESIHSLKPPVVHNDITVSNIMIREDGSVKLFDFDISRVYKKGQRQNTVLFGTESVAAPEHYGYGQSEPRTDIYCLGATMHKMLTGAGLDDEHRVTYNGRLKSILEKCTEYDPSNRYESATELIKVLETFLKRKKIILARVIGGICVVAVIALVLFLNQLIGNDADSNGGRGNESFVEQSAEGNNSNISESSNNASGVGSELESSDENSDATSSVQDESKESVKNDSRENAKEIVLKEKYSGSFDVAEGAFWYKFTARNDAEAYRISVSSDKLQYHQIAIYDYTGIKIDQKTKADGANRFIDLYLEPGEEYFVKISKSYGTRGEFEVCVSDKVIDAGKDEASAVELTVGERYTATLDSTLSDWFAFCAQEDGRYTYTIHNIDVGCRISVKSHQEGLTNTTYISNEDNATQTTYEMTAGETVYFEVQVDGNGYNADGFDADGQYIIVVEKFVK